MRRCPALAALLVVGIVASGCSVGTRRDRDRRSRWPGSAARTVLDERCARGPNRRSEYARPPDQPRCRPVRAGRRRRPRPHDVRAGGRDADGVRRRGQGDHPRRSAIPRGSGAVRAANPRRLRGSPSANARTSRCRWQPAHPSKNAESCRSTRRVAWRRSGPRTRSSAPKPLRPSRPTGSPSSTACRRARPKSNGPVAVSPSKYRRPRSWSVRRHARTSVRASAQVFDRIVENNRLRAFIEAQPPGSWRDAGLRVAEHGSGLLFRAVTTMFERPATATITVDGSDVGDLVLPGRRGSSARVRPSARHASTGHHRHPRPVRSRDLRGRRCRTARAPFGPARRRRIPRRRIGAAAVRCRRGFVHGVRDARPLSRLVGRERRARDRRGLGRAHGRLEAWIHRRGRWRHCRIHPGRRVRRAGADDPCGSVGLGGVPAGGLRLADGA